MSTTDSERAESAWKELFWQVALALKCLPSSYIDGNEHVLRQAKKFAAISAPQEGWVLVPVEPTSDMLEAGGFSVNMNYHYCQPGTIAKAAYARMIAARPQALSDGGRGGK